MASQQKSPNNLISGLRRGAKALPNPDDRDRVRGTAPTEGNDWESTEAKRAESPRRDPHSSPLFHLATLNQPIRHAFLAKTCQQVYYYGTVCRNSYYTCTMYARVSMPVPGAIARIPRGTGKRMVPAWVLVLAVGLSCFWSFHRQTSWQLSG